MATLAELRQAQQQYHEMVKKGKVSVDVEKCWVRVLQELDEEHGSLARLEKIPRTPLLPKTEAAFQTLKKALALVL